MKESKVQKEILQFLHAKRIFVWRNHSTGIYDPTKGGFRRNNSYGALNGVADILGILPDGRFLAIEVKTPATKNNLSILQSNFLTNINKSYGVAFVAWSIESVEEVLSVYLNVQ